MLYTGDGHGFYRSPAAASDGCNFPLSDFYKLEENPIAATVAFLLMPFGFHLAIDTLPLRRTARLMASVHRGLFPVFAFVLVQAFERQSDFSLPRLINCTETQDWGPGGRNRLLPPGLVLALNLRTACRAI
jgi:hypothetical protein